MAIAKPLVIFVFTKEGKPGSTRYGGFAKRLKRYGGLQGARLLTCALENLIFSIDEKGTAQVQDTVSGTSFNEASLVYLKSWEAMPEEACALTLFLEHRGIPYVDGLPKNVGISKLATMFRMWAAGIRVPQTYYVRHHQKLQQFFKTEALSWPLVIKDAFGEKGKLNFLAHNQAEAQQILADNPEVSFICQRFIPNEGDYRIGVYMGQASFAILRKGDGSSHLNNTSAGGKASYIEIADLPVGLATFAEGAAAAADLKIAGVDVIVDRKNKKPHILEVNQGSQIVTGAFVEQNITAFNAAFDQALRKRHTRPATKPMNIIGRRTFASLPDLGVQRIVAKIDTGAYTSSIHAENIQVSQNAKGEETLSFDIFPGDKVKMFNGRQQRVTTNDFFTKLVTSSSGHATRRYAIRTTLTIEGRTFRTALTLTDRSVMGHPLLIGRVTLRSRFLVNVELSEYDHAYGEVVDGSLNVQTPPHNEIME